MTTLTQNRQYEKLLTNVQESMASNSQVLFQTDTKTLFDVFLLNIPVEHRQHYTCRNCERFLNAFGGLVYIADSVLIPVMWNFECKGFFAKAVDAMRAAVSKSEIVDTFNQETTVLGTPQTGEWNHFSARPTAFKTQPSRLQDYLTVELAIGIYDEKTVDKALVLINSEVLYRSEAVLGQAQFLKDIYQARKGLRGKAKNNALWRLIAESPAGFCHPRSSMIGTLLDDLSNGLDAENAAKKFASKMHPLQYQRPTAAPTAGNIAAAEKVIKKMEAEGSLQRRYCTVDEIKALWVPKPKKKAKTSGVFADLNPKSSEQSAASSPKITTMTWDKFSRTILPTAERITYRPPYRATSYAPLVTAANPESPPILQWDEPDARNPVSWYMYDGGKQPSHFGLQVGVEYDISAVCFQPSMWSEKHEYSHLGKGVMFIIDGARESRSGSLALFPSILRSEFHEIRATIEAFSKTRTVEGVGSPHAVGLLLQNSNSWDAIFEVTSAGQKIQYKLDRWD